ncbi:hypothetical protein AVEN_138154-1 [Araneus ventricosus]|uniref:OTU domain-containing protein n=1 Tax=Araneus ventricosus TaxID=182803 RepID=A0A4Y2LX93_ARAVE|nr:hypothetical protein AVEN_138154-1 [Araneus ventricosus]
MRRRTKKKIWKNKKKKRNSRNAQKSKKSALELSNKKIWIRNDGARFEIQPMKGDGSCLFRAMSYFVFGNQDNHDFTRLKVVKYISDHWDRFKNFASGRSVEDYENHMNTPGTYGGEAEIVAFSYLFRCQVHVLFKHFPERSAVTFGTDSVQCFMIYSGPPDEGHYDVLVPSTNQACNLHLYKELINQLRYVTAAVYELDLADFKEKKNNSGKRSFIKK